MYLWRTIRYFLLILLLLSGLAFADTAAFDLPGPQINIRVTRDSKTLPISQVPNLQPGDRLWLHPNLPPDQSAHYLLIVAFLRGSTNPPPEAWFTKVETWRKPAREEGLFVTVPQDAQQVLLFLAPETGGDFSSLRAAVRGRPGAFVRASQDLNRASLDRSRLDAYLTAVQQTSDSDPKQLQERSKLLARSLSIKLDQQCFDKPTEQQAPCLTQNTDQLVLDDGHSQSMVAALTSGASADLIGQLSNTPTFGAGLYSPYVGAVVDVARVLTSFRNPQYQFIPALSLAKDGRLDLRLNNPPSFRKPKSVIVIGLPAVGTAQLPPLRPLDAKASFCLQKPGLVLGVEGAPLIFSTQLGHDFVVQVQDKSGKPLDLPTTPDAAQGGFVVDTTTAKPGELPAVSAGRLRGWWGFQSFEGPAFHLLSSQPAKWTLPGSGASALVVGRQDSVHLEADNASCVNDVTAEGQHGTKLVTTWKLRKPNQVEVQVSLKDAAPGQVTLLIKQWGLSDADTLQLQPYAEPGRVDGFLLYAGDQQGVLTGSRLDEVSELDVNGIRFLPAGFTRVNNQDHLELSASDAAAAQAFHQDEKLVASVVLKDGRMQQVPMTVAPPRPRVTLLSKSVQEVSSSSAAPIHLGSQDELPIDGRLSFFLRSDVPEVFSHTDKVEVETADNAFHTLLTETDGSVTLQDAHAMYVVFDPLKSFGSGAFGSIRFRPVNADGVAGDWQPLAKLVRLPLLTDMQCPDAPVESCIIAGHNLFLIDSVAADPQFKEAQSVPEGFLESTLAVPRPKGAKLYIKLRDDLNTVNEISVSELHMVQAKEP